MANREFAYQQRILNHYEYIWNNTAKSYLWDKGPFERLPIDFRVLEFPPNEKRNVWTYATCCMSQQEDISPVELHILSSIHDTTLIELLSVIAYYHRTTEKLYLNHTVYFGRPWQNNSNCDHGLISLPYLDGPDLENLGISNHKIIKFYWLIPITTKELDFKLKHGTEALEDRFEESQIEYTNPNRNSLV